MLKKEILDQERGLKSQIATLEKKAHENWVAARQAERKLEESKQEAAQLRNRLTMMEKNINNDLEAKQNHRKFFILTLNLRMALPFRVFTSILLFQG